jgi:hypothetical protein
MSTMQTPRSQTEQILANPFISVPVVFAASRSGNDLHLYSTFLGSPANGQAEERVCGSIVANPDVIGASAQVLAVQGKVNGQPSQRLLIKTLGPQAPSQAKTLDFFPVFAAGSTAQKNPTDGTNLYMKVTDGLLPPSVDAGTMNSLPSIPLIVGPDSAVIGTMDPESLKTLNALGVDWGGLLNIAKKVLPVVAKAGYQIYQEVSNPSQQKAEPHRGRKDGENVTGFFDVIMSVAKIAVPIAGSLISAL